MLELATGISSSATRVMTPVRPRPPIVAAKAPVVSASDQRVFSAIAAHQIKLANPSADRPGAMMILAVDIVGDCPAKRDKFRAGGDRQEIAGRDDEMKNFRQADTGLGNKNAGCSIKTDKVVETGHIDDRAVVVDAAVSVRPPQSRSEKMIWSAAEPSAIRASSSSRNDGRATRICVRGVLPHGKMSERERNPVTTPTEWIWRQKHRDQY